MVLKLCLLSSNAIEQQKDEKYKEYTIGLKKVSFKLTLEQKKIT